MILQTVAHKSPLFMGFLRQEYWNGLPFPSPDLPDPGFKPMSPALQVDSLLLSLVSQSQQIPPSSQDEHGGRAALQSIARIKAFFFFPAMDQFSFLSVEPQTIYFRLILLLLSTCVCGVTFIKNNISN